MLPKRTLCILKPDIASDATKVQKVQEILKKAGFTVVRSKVRTLSKAQAEAFYAEHRARPFFGDLCGFISSGPALFQIIKADNGIKKYRELMGATDPKKAAPETLRALFGASIDHNAVHGSDSPKSASREIKFFEKL